MDHDSYGPRDVYGYGPDQRGPYSTPDRRPFGQIPPETFRQVPPSRPPRFNRLVGWIVGLCLGGIVVVGIYTSLAFDGATTVIMPPSTITPTPALTSGCGSAR